MKKQRIIAQLVVGPAEKRRFRPDEVIAAVSLATKIAGLDSLLYWPSGEIARDQQLIDQARDLGLKVFLWLPVLADAGKDPEMGEQAVGLGGAVGQGSAGSWHCLGKSDESFLFACPRSRAQLETVRWRCHDELPRYDGVFLDRIRYPPPANGLEMLGSCFCQRCLEADRDAPLWREQAYAVCEILKTAADRDLERWGDFYSLPGFSELAAWRESRRQAIADVVCGLAETARNMGKEVGLDLFTPALAPLVGQDYRRLGLAADWIKPMSYCHAKGPAGLPLELACLARGLLETGRSLSAKAVMAFVGRTTGLACLPDSPDRLEREGLPEEVLGLEYAKAAALTARPLFPGFECVRHPDFGLDMSEEGIKQYLEAASGAPGLTLAWNILYTPRRFLELVRSQ